jgi:hypothetical protein
MISGDPPLVHIVAGTKGSTKGGGSGDTTDSTSAHTSSKHRCCGCFASIRRGKHRLRAWLLYHTHPYDLNLWTKAKDPVWLIVNFFVCTNPYATLRFGFYLILIWAIDRRDEYQIVQFIKSFKAFHFLSQGVLGNYNKYMNYNPLPHPQPVAQSLLHPFSPSALPMPPSLILSSSLHPGLLVGSIQFLSCVLFPPFIAPIDYFGGPTTIGSSSTSTASSRPVITNMSSPCEMDQNSTSDHPEVVYAFSIYECVKDSGPQLGSGYWYFYTEIVGFFLNVMIIWYAFGLLKHSRQTFIDHELDDKLKDMQESGNHHDVHKKIKRAKTFHIRSVAKQQQHALEIRSGCAESANLL